MGCRDREYDREIRGVSRMSYLYCKVKGRRRKKMGTVIIYKIIGGRKREVTDVR
jgi:hypothetical protein